MSYQVLARKWRPKTFQAMLGQAHVLQALMNALDQQRLHHAYLFTGTRGVGKTTIARILAKALNCSQGISATPCEQCNNCVAINAACFVDLIEVDAASRTKVEDTRELLDNVQYLPAQGRFKIYLIDEIHMLSGHSFNALLKTLEEPPAHVKFLLATTDPQKLPVTILSRCLQFNLTKISVDHIVKQAQIILDQENIQYEKTALSAIAQAADGSMRDALSLLDQAIIYCDKIISKTQIQHMLGFIEQTHLIRLLQAIADYNAQQCMDIIQQLAAQAADFNNALQDLLSLLHHIALAQVIPTAITKSIPDHEQIHQLAIMISREDIQLFYQIGLTGQQHLALAPSLKSGFEMLILRMLAFRPALTNSQATTKTAPSQQVPAATMDIQETPAPYVVKKVHADDNLIDINAKDVCAWSAIIPQLKLSGMTKILAEHCILESCQGNEISLLLAAKQAPLLSEKLQGRLAEALNHHYGKKVILNISIATTEINSPINQKQSNAEHAIHNDLNVKAIMTQFNATIVPGSIKQHQPKEET